jgi:hypothetical protein
MPLGSSGMKRSYWLIFGLVQAMGIVAAIGALILQFPTLLLLTLLLLLPGTLVSVGLSRPDHVGANWSYWTLGAIAVVANVLLFATTSSLLRRYRESK